MGVEFHITRADLWPGSNEVPITAEEWMAYVNIAPDLELVPERGPHYVLWLGASAYEEPWLDWSDGRIYTKWPDTALYSKMLDIAKQFDAAVHDDEDTVYSGPDEWKFDPNVKLVLPAKRRPWWKFW